MLGLGFITSLALLKPPKKYSVKTVLKERRRDHLRPKLKIIDLAVDSRLVPAGFLPAAARAAPAAWMSRLAFLVPYLGELCKAALLVPRVPRGWAEQSATTASDNGSSALVESYASMKVVGITILRTGGNDDPVPVGMACDLSSYGFFQRQGVKEMLTFFSKTFTKRTEPGQRQSISHESYVIHCYVRSDGLAGQVITDAEYPARVAFVLLTALLDEFTTQMGDSWKTMDMSVESSPFPVLEDYLVKYQDPASADKVTKIQNDLDETTNILHKTIDSVLERGVKLDSLVEKSDDLSRQSKAFYKQAKKTNSCCVVS